MASLYLCFCFLYSPCVILLISITTTMQGSYGSPQHSTQSQKAYVPPRRWRRVLTFVALACTTVTIVSHFQYIWSNTARLQHVQWIEAQLGDNGHEATLHTTPISDSFISTAIPGDDASNTAAADPAETPSEGISESISKIVVMGRLSTENTAWVSELPDWQSAVYDVEPSLNGTSRPNGLRTSVNKAHEAMPYLTYIADNYPSFPDVIAFVHAHRDGYPKAWHTDAFGHSAVTMLQDLRVETVLARGYVNLRCNGIPGCPAEIEPFRKDLDEEKQANADAFLDVYGSFFNKTRAEMEREIPVVATPCCAQFAVSRQQILARPKEDYERYLHLLETTKYDDYTAGRILEYMWHIMFGRDAVHCEDMMTCYCDVFGRCDELD